MINDTTEKTNVFADIVEQQFSPNRTPDINWESRVERQERRITELPSNNQLTPTSPRKIKEIIASVGNHKTPGHNDISTLSVKHLPLTGQINELTNIINGIFRLQVFPAQWKIATVIMIRKPQNATFPQNCRSISLLSHLGRIAEKVILHRLEEETGHLNILPDALGFRSQYCKQQD